MTLDRWKIVTEVDTFRQQKTDEKFAALVTLGRALNALRFVQDAMVAHEGDTSPAGVRARTNALLFSCAIFAEVELLVRQMSKHFRAVPEFMKLTDLTTKNQEATELLNSSLRLLRNKLVFHFDIKQTLEQLATIDLREPSFVSGQGRSNGQVYYDLSDLCALRLFCGPPGASEQEIVRSALKRGPLISDLIIGFSTAADEFLVAALKSLDWVGGK